jgi:hypothetical protein
MLECLGILFEKSENSLKSSSLICHSPTKPIWCSSWKPYTHMLLVIALSFVKLLWPLWEFFSCIHDQDLCAHHHFPLALLLHWKLALYHPSIPPNKDLCIVPWFTLSRYLQKSLGYEKRKTCSKSMIKKEKEKIARASIISRRRVEQIMQKGVP